VAGTGGTVSAGGSFATGSTQTITATAAAYYSFTSWSGDTGCSGVASHTIVMDANKSCTANFTATAIAAPATPTVTVTQPTGSTTAYTWGAASCPGNTARYQYRYTYSGYDSGLVATASTSVTFTTSTEGYTYTVAVQAQCYNTATTSSWSAAGSGSYLRPGDWLTIGTQVWGKYNLNVGTQVTGSSNQTNNSVVEKYCYANNTTNCTNYGGLYQWAEAVQYKNGATNTTSPSPAFSGNVQGICPAGSHIPSDNEWKILEIQLGMTQAQADATATWRGTDQGTKLKSGGTSGLALLLAGLRYTNASYLDLPTDGYYWSSLQSSAANAWIRSFYSDYATVLRDVYGKGVGFSVRCLQD